MPRTSGFSDRSGGFAWLAIAVLLGSTLAARAAHAEGGTTVALRFTPVARAQIALWLEAPDGTFLGTVKLTQGVSVYGIGNRPGAAQMNSGFHWPYGRREGVLPVWAHRRAAAPGAQTFRRVIFQNRQSEGDASRTADDASPDAYFCLSFTQSTTRENALDAVTCASQFSSDKGRYLRQDEANVYAEPFQVNGVGDRRPLSSDSLYPPRRDVSRCTATTCRDTPDVDLYATDARAVMPDIDAVTMATVAGGMQQEVLFTIPASWPTDLVAWLEINVEGDHNAMFSETNYPTPTLPSGEWDSWAVSYGYPYRGQPSVVFKVPFSLSAQAPVSTSAPAGFGSLEGYGPDGGTLHAMDKSITNDPKGAPGSGVDRLLAMSDGARFSVQVRSCQQQTAPGKPGNLEVHPVADPKHSHEWGTLSFSAPTDGAAVNQYEVRFGREPIVDDESFKRGLPAVQADLDSKALMLPTQPDSNGRITAAFGGMIPQTTFYVGVRALDACNHEGPLATGSLTTTKINFTKLPDVEPWKGQCFIATAAFGSPMAPSVNAIRQVRDRARQASGLFAAIDDLYHQASPPAAGALARSETARALFRELLSPVARASSLTPPSR
jgi:hypothetical protein